MPPSINAVVAAVCAALTAFGFALGWPTPIAVLVMALGIASALSVLLRKGVWVRSNEMMRWMWRGVPVPARIAWAAMAAAIVARHVWSLAHRAPNVTELATLNGCYFAITGALMAWAYQRTGAPPKPAKSRVAAQRKAIRAIRDYWAYHWFLMGFRTSLGAFAIALGFGVLMGCTQWKPLLVPVLAAMAAAALGWLAMLVCFVPMQIWVRRNAPDVREELRRQMFRDLFEKRFMPTARTTRTR